MPRWRWEEGWVSNVPAMVTVLGLGGFDLGLQKGTWTHLLALKTASALWDQFTHLSRSSCREAVCAAGTTVGGETQTMLESSANRVRSLDWGMLGRELIERLNNRGPRWEPCGTPAVSDIWVDKEVPTRTDIDRPSRKSISHANESGAHQPDRHEARRRWLVRSNAFEKSRKTASHWARYTCRIHATGYCLALCKMVVHSRKGCRSTSLLPLHFCYFCSLFCRVLHKNSVILGCDFKPLADYAGIIFGIILGFCQKIMLPHNYTDSNV